MSSIVDFMKAAGGIGASGGMPTRPGGMPGFDRLVQMGGPRTAMPAAQLPQPTIATPQEYWLGLGQGKMGRDQELEKMLGIGSQNALAAYLPFLGLK